MYTHLTHRAHKESGHKHPDIFCFDLLNTELDTLHTHAQREGMPTRDGFRKDEGLLRRTFKASTDSMRNPRTSMSQLRLKELNAHTETLERFGIEELRDGFFDPIYTKHQNVGDSTTHANKSNDGFIRINITNATIVNRLTHALKHWKPVSKFTLAYFIGLVLCLVKRTGDWLGPHRLWLPISVIINHPVHDIGTQLEMTLVSIVGLALGLGWSSLALFISTSTQPTRNHQGGILAGSLFLGLFLMGWFRAHYARFYYMLLTSGLTLVFLSANLQLSDPSVHWKSTWDFGIPYLLGLLLSLVVSVMYFPILGHEKIMDSILNSTTSIRDLLKALTTVQRGDDTEMITSLQKEMVSSVLILAENFREFLSGTKLSLYNDEDLKSIRNHLNLMTSPLRVIPTPLNIYYGKEKAINLSTTDTPTLSPLAGSSTQASSGIATPLPKLHVPSSIRNNPQFGIQSEMIYISIMNDAFNVPLFKLITQMVEQLTQIEITIKNVSRLHTDSTISKPTLISKLEEDKLLLKKRVYEMDLAYKKFTKTDNFCRDLLNEGAVINIFLTLRYTRQSAVMLMKLAETVISASSKVQSWKIYWPNYPFMRGLRRLPEQCLRDQGADQVYHYFETKLDVVDAFERIYNLNTSRNKDLPHDHLHEDSKIIRAIDHKDFNFHSTKNPLRFKAWTLLASLTDTESKYAFKVSLVTVFLSLPAWLDESWSWYWHYNCYWCPILIYFFLSPKNSSSWNNVATRLLCWLIGCFWGWAANASRKYCDPIVIGVFGALICCLLSYGFLVLKHPRSSLIGLLGFTIVSLTVKNSAAHNGDDVFKCAWILSLSILVSICASVLTNRVIWPFVAKKELYNACSSLLQHIGQSYQSVSERYLYRDENDDPTSLTLELANIREVRMSQSVVAVKLLLEKALKDHDWTGMFKPQLFERLLSSCDTMLEKIIEARMSGVYFKVWEQDKDVETTQALLSFRRDSVATVIYLLYILSNAFMSRSQVPRYLPSSIGIRKKLYDIIAELEAAKESRSDTIVEQLTERLTQVETEQMGNTVDEKSYEKSHWTEVHGLAFARAFTSITEELENIVRLSKEILGEEGIFD